jgi:hypothetical protein
MNLATAHDQIGFELGWDHAHHGLCPPAPYRDEPSPLHHGLTAGQATFGVRTLSATSAVRHWLALRLHAWLRGRSVELIQVTPHYLRQIQVGHCPITRAALADAGADDHARGGDASSIDRVRDDAGYAAGNLALLSRRANHAKAGHGYRSAWELAQRLAAEELAGSTERGAELAAHEWARVAVLCSFVEALPHEQACVLPLLVLPPNRLRLFNPVQALQAMLSRQLLQPGWSRRISRFEALLPDAASRRDFKRFFFTLLPRVLEAGRPGDDLATRWAIEDAWRSPRVLQAWSAFAGPLGAAATETLLTRAAARGIATLGVEAMSPAQATDGWNLTTRGYVAPAAAEPRRTSRRAAATPQAQLAF